MKSMRSMKRAWKNQWIEQMSNAAIQDGKKVIKEKDGRRVCVYQCQICRRDAKMRITKVMLPDAPGICKFCCRYRKDKVMEWIDANQN